MTLWRRGHTPALFLSYLWTRIGSGFSMAWIWHFMSVNPPVGYHARIRVSFRQSICRVEPPRLGIRPSGSARFSHLDACTARCVGDFASIYDVWNFRRAGSGSADRSGEPVLAYPARMSRTQQPAGSALSATGTQDRKSTRLNSSHSQISYAVFCLKK